MKTRVITAICALCVFIPFVIFSGTWALEIFFALLNVIAVLEIVNCVGMIKNPFAVFPTALYAIATLLPARRMGSTEHYIFIMFAATFLYLFIMLTFSVFSKGKLPIREAALITIMTFYITFGFSSMLILRARTFGFYIFLLVFLSAWITDAGAYFVGVLFGRHKLIEDVSPKKTIEGAVGGIVICVAAFCIYGFIVGRICEATPKYLSLCAAGAIMALISQCGDLIASLIKRQYNIKDYGKILPGHGGIMDRFDSIIATAPFFFFLSSFSSFFEIFF